MISQFYPPLFIYNMKGGVFIIILALDQASRTTGYSVFKDNELIEFGHWDKSQTDIAIRIYSLCQEIEKKISQYEPQLVVLENIQMQHGEVSTFQKLAQVQGGIMTMLAAKKIDYELIYPSEWRAECHFLQGNDKRRENQKKIAQTWVAETYGKKCTQDESDAICIGYAATKMRANAFC